MEMGDLYRPPPPSAMRGGHRRTKPSAAPPWLPHLFFRMGDGRRKKTRLISKCGAGGDAILNGILLLDLWAQMRALVWTEERRLGPPRDRCGQLH
jgi:hypothetical protein